MFCESNNPVEEINIFIIYMYLNLCQFSFSFVYYQNFRSTYNKKTNVTNFTAERVDLKTFMLPLFFQKKLFV